MKKIYLMGTIILTLTAFILVTNILYLSRDEYKYNRGINLYEDRKYKEVIKLFNDFAYRESKKYVENSYVRQSEIISKKSLSDAIEYIDKCTTKKCLSKKIEYLYLEAVYYSDKDTNKTIELLSLIDPYIDENDEYNEIIYNMAINNIDDNDRYLEVLNLLNKIPDYQDVESLIKELQEKHKYDGTWKSKNIKNDTRYWIFKGNKCYISNSTKTKYTKYSCKYKDSEIKVLDNKKEIYKITLEYGVLSYKWNKKITTDEKDKWLMNKISNDYMLEGSIYEPEIGMTKKELEGSKLGTPDNKVTKKYKLGVFEIYQYSDKNIILLDDIIIEINDKNE